MGIPAEQQEVAAFLRRLTGKDPTETHISAVFVGPRTAWKMKKAVRLPYLDFTALADRRRFLERELELNQPAAPEIYRDVAAVIRGRHGPLAITPEPEPGKALEWVLRMAPIPARDFLDAVADRGELTAPLLDALGDCIAAYHARLAPVPDWDNYGGLLHIANGTMASALEAGLPGEAASNWIIALRDALGARRAWLAERADAGFVRRGHGDLHLGNLCLWRGRPAPFDALEFDERLATTDLGYDLAFLLMDLDRRVGRPAANRVLNRYVARTGDAGLTRGLPAFLSLRAMVLAHVQASRGKAAALGDYLQGAGEYLRPPPAVVVAIGGLQGTGKSTLAQLLAPEIGPAPGALVLRSDATRKRLFGKGPEDRLPAEAYEAPANDAMAQALVEAARLAAAGGHAVIADATFLDPGQRAAIEAAARAAGVPFRGIWLHAPPTLLEARIAGRRGDASDATVDVLRAALAQDPGKMDWRPVDAQDTERAATEIRQNLLYPSSEV